MDRTIIIWEFQDNFCINYITLGEFGGLSN